MQHEHGFVSTIDIRGHRGQNQVINKVISEYAEIKKALQDASLPGRKWSEHTSELKKTLSEQEDLSKKIENARHEKSRLTRLQQALSDVALREKWLSELLELGEVVVVDDGFGKTRRGYLDHLRMANDASERSTVAIERLNEDMGRIVIPRGVLDQAATISDLHLRLGSHRKGLLDLGGLTGNMQQLSQDIEILASEIGTTVSDRPKAALRARIQDLGGKHQALLDALARSDKDIRKTKGALAKAMEGLQSLSAPRSIHALKSAVTVVQCK